MNPVVENGVKKKILKWKIQKIPVAEHPSSRTGSLRDRKLATGQVKLY